MEKKWKSATKTFSVNAGTGRKDVEEMIAKDVNDFINYQTGTGRMRSSRKTWFREPKETSTLITCIVDYEELEKKEVA